MDSFIKWAEIQLQMSSSDGWVCRQLVSKQLYKEIKCCTAQFDAFMSPSGQNDYCSFNKLVALLYHSSTSSITIRKI